MTSVEAAASLFGTSDSGSDMDFLTAPEGPNSASDSPAHTGVGDSNELFASSDSSGLNEGPGTVSSLFEAQGDAGTQLYGQDDSHSAHPEAYEPDSTYGYGQGAQAPFDYNGGGYASYAEGWYDENGQWHAHEHQEEMSATSGLFDSANPQEFFG